MKKQALEAIADRVLRGVYKSGASAIVGPLRQSRSDGIAGMIYYFDVATYGALGPRVDRVQAPAGKADRTRVMNALSDHRPVVILPVNNDASEADVMKLYEKLWCEEMAADDPYRFRW